MLLIFYTFLLVIFSMAAGAALYRFGLYDGGVLKGGGSLKGFNGLFSPKKGSDGASWANIMNYDHRSGTDK